MDCALVSDSLEMGSLLSEQQQHTLQQDERLPRCCCLCDAELTVGKGPLSHSLTAREGAGLLPSQDRDLRVQTHAVS